MTNRITHATVVYQGGLANVFATKRFDSAPKRERLIQGSFGQCENFALGLKAAGVSIEYKKCNHAGDIIDSDWNPWLGEKLPIGWQY